MVQDRFHASSKPHKSPLYLFHNIDLCPQANCVATSTQESENARKNQRRLRSTCAQNFGLHFLFNFLMDFYQNQAIVKAQNNSLQSHLKCGQKISRDRFHRFAIVSDINDYSSMVQVYNLLMLKCYYDQKITFIFSSDFETMFVKHSPSEIISVNFEKKTVNLNCNFPV